MPSLRRTVPPAPAGFDQDTFFQGVYWHQRWQLFEDVFTPGPNSIEEMCADMNLPLDLSGKRVLDIGAWNGCLSFECERRGAREVIALGPEDPRETGFERLRAACGSTRTRYLLGSVYDLNPEKLGYFDVVLFCGVLYHLRYPLLGLDNLRRVCTGEVFIETYVSNWRLALRNLLRFRRGLLPLLLLALLPAPLWQFFRRDELEGDPSNWFGPNPTAVVQALESAGFEARHLTNRRGRATFSARVRDGVPEFLAIGTAEGVFFDVIVGPLFGKERLGLGSVVHMFHSAVLASEEYFRQAGNTPLAWLARLYTDLLGRPASPAETTAALDRLGAGEAVQRQALAAALLTSREYLMRQVSGSYATLLGRPATPAEVETMVKGQERGASAEQVLGTFLSSEEYFARHGGAHRAWLERVSHDLFGSGGRPESADLVSALDARSLTRGEVVSRLLASREYHEQRLALLVRTHLGHPPHPHLSGWLEMLHTDSAEQGLDAA